MKTKILSILALLLMTVTQGAWAQETLTVFDGNGTSQHIPMDSYDFDNYTKSECIIPASELTAMEGGTITAITFYANTVAGDNPTFGTANQKVFLKEVSGTTLSSYSGMTDATVVFDGTLPMPTTSASGYTISFSQGYTYNGGNLLIGVYNDAIGKYNKVIWYGNNNQSERVSAYGYSFSSLASVSFSKQTFLPKTTFTYTPAPGTAVDLGLPSGKKWADRNVGAGSETGYGTYYAWSSSDIATAQWGNDWRMPTQAEIEELKSYTDHEWATIGGVNGMKFMKKTDHSVYIFLPATGLNSSTEVGTIGYHWTSTEESSPHAYFLYTSSSSVITSYYRTKTSLLPIRPVQMFAGEGTEASPYLIANTTDWNNLSAAVNGGETYSGKYFKMTANVGTVATTVGTSANPFDGTFDGNGHTLTMNISNSNAQTRTAPFAWAGGSAVIKNLHVTGSLTNTERTSGIVGSCYATTQISSCRVSATISGGNHTSGISISGGQITNCLFDGMINGTYSTAGFATYPASGTKITNCLFKPQDGSSIPSSQGCFYASEGTAPTLTNCYYTSLAGGTAQGTDGSGMTPAQLVQNLGPSNWKVVGGNAIPKVHPNLSGEGTEASPYLIASTTDWNNLVSAVNAGETYSGNYFKMTANVGTVSTWMTGTFSGTFDGYGNTLTVGYSTSARYCAPFGTLGGTVKNLRVDGTLSTSGKNFGGIAAQVTSGKTATIQNCRVSTSFTSTLSGDNSSSSFVGVVWSGGTLNITGCAFTGSLTGSGNAFGGFLGYKEGTCSMTDCLFAPASVTVSTEFAGTFSRPSAPTITNCYFTRTFGTAQGLQARTITKGANVTTLAISGAGTEYDVSGITSYGTGIQYGGVLYGGNEDAVSLTLTAPEHDGYGFVYSADNGTVTGNSNPYTLTMVDANAIINVKYSASKAINKYTSDDTSDGWYLIASPIGIVSPEDVTNMTANTYDIYRFNQNPTPTMVDEVSQYLEWENWKQEGDHYHFDLEPGKGYLYANSGNVTLTFIGTPNEEGGIVPLVRSNSNGNDKANMLGWNLIGNPFGVTAYIDRDFYRMNYGEGNTGGNEIIPATNTSSPIAPMEGIFVYAEEEGLSVTFSTQAPSKGHIQKPESEQVVLNLSRDRGSVIDRAIVRMDEGQTLPKFQIRENSTKLYIPQGTEEYAIVSVGNVGEMPVNFKAKENGNYTISVNPENVEMSYLHLIDNMTGADVDLLQTPSYTFNATTTDYESRFKLVFCTGSSTSSETFAFCSNGNWIISNEGQATLQVIDVTGRILSSETVNGSVSKAINAVPGVYMLRLINGDNVKV